MKTIRSMIQCLLTILLMSISSSVNAQFRSVHCGKSPKELKIEQIDFLENTTLIHIRFQGEGDIYNYYHFNFYEKTFIEVPGDTKKYHLLNSYNVPINKGEAEYIGTMVENPNYVHTFTLEFEKIPESKAFNIIEIKNHPNAYNFIDVSYDNNPKSELLDIEKYVEPYPMKIFGYYLHENHTIKYYWHNGILLSVCLLRNKNYGNYWEVQFDIKNYSGNSILFNPNLITATMVKNPSKINECYVEPLQVYSFAEYSKKIKRKQTWESIGFGIAQGLSSLSYGTNYNRDVANVARLMAIQNSMILDMQQNTIRERLEYGYAKMNTLRDRTEYSGHINIRYQKTDNLKLTFRIGKENYSFLYVF